ncbi:GNAT family N-acetyltransferase [Bdellovibrionota bacterium FG-2]
MRIITKALTPTLWPALESLFGSKGACGGCWCMYWRIEKSEKWEEIKGPAAKSRLKKLVASGKAQGVLAFIDNEAVDWCSLGKRVDFDRLNRAPSLACDDAEEVWSAPCFYIRPGFRQKGVATALLRAASALAKKKGARILEGYPVKPNEAGAIPAAFAWTGTQSLFGKAGFKVVGNRDGGKQRVRKDLKK